MEENEFEKHTRSLYCYEDELPCVLTKELFDASFVDGVRLYPWREVARQLKKENEGLRKFIQEKARYIPKAGGGFTELEWMDG